MVAVVAAAEVAIVVLLLLEAAKPKLKPPVADEDPNVPKAGVDDGAVEADDDKAPKEKGAVGVVAGFSVLANAPNGETDLDVSLEMDDLDPKVVDGCDDEVVTVLEEESIENVVLTLVSDFFAISSGLYLLVISLRCLS